LHLRGSPTFISQSLSTNTHTFLSTVLLLSIFRLTPSAASYRSPPPRLALRYTGGFDLLRNQSTPASVHLDDAAHGMLKEGRKHLSLHLLVTSLLDPYGSGPGQRVVNSSHNGRQPYGGV
ncbi:hypothetical protein M8C21_015225, partial [Ambrosia artemisiifolia]